MSNVPQEHARLLGQPMTSRMIANGKRFNALREVLAMIACIDSIKLVRQKTDQWRQLCSSTDSDLLATLEIWEFVEQHFGLSTNYSRDIRSELQRYDIYTTNLESAVARFEKLLQEHNYPSKGTASREQLRLCGISGFVHWVWKLERDNSYCHLGEERKALKAFGTVVGPEPLVFGLPIEVYGPTGRPVTLLGWVSTTSVEELDNIAPGTIRSSRSGTPYIAKGGKVVRRQIVTYRGDVASEREAACEDFDQTSNSLAALLADPLFPAHFGSEYPAIAEVLAENLRQAQAAYIARVPVSKGMILSKDFRLTEFYLSRLDRSITALSQIADPERLRLPNFDTNAVAERLLISSNVQLRDLERWCDTEQVTRQLNALQESLEKEECLLDFPQTEPPSVYVVSASGDLREPDGLAFDAEKPNKEVPAWQLIRETDLVLRYARQGISFPWVMKNPIAGPTEAQLARVHQLEESLGLHRNAFGCFRDLPGKAKLLIRKAVPELLAKSNVTFLKLPDEWEIEQLVAARGMTLSEDAGPIIRAFGHPSDWTRSSGGEKSVSYQVLENIGTLMLLAYQDGGRLKVAIRLELKT